MNAINYKLIILAIYCCNFQITYCQTLSFGFGPIFAQSVQKVKIVNGENDFDHVGFSYTIQYSHDLKMKRCELFASYYSFAGKTNMVIIPSKAQYEYGNGFKGLNVRRINLGISYALLNLNHFFLKTGLGLGLQIAKRNGYDPFDSIYEIYGPDYTMNEPFYYNYNFFQIVPLLSVKAGLVIWNRLDLHIDIQGVYGFKSYQTMYLNYSYKGIKQSTAIVEARGTGFFPSIGIGYKFKWIKGK